MLALLLTIASSVLTSVILKVNEGRGGNRIVVAGANYVVAAILAALFLTEDPLAIETRWKLVGAAAGVGFVAGFLMLMKGLKDIGLAIPTSAARLSMLIPVTGSILLFDERPTPLKLAGIGAGVLSFVLLGLAQRRARAESGGEKGGLDLAAVGVLVAIFAIVGTTDFTMKIAQTRGLDKDVLTLYIFTTAALLCWGIVALRRIPVKRKEVGLGLLLGVPNYFSVYFLLLALRSLDASSVFPAVSAGAVVAITLVAVLFWKEHPSAVAWIGIALAAASVVMLGMAAA